MIIYIYTEGNSTIETIDINEIPQGVLYETVEREEVEEIIEPTTPIANEIVINLLTKQVETMSEEEKTDILQTLLTQ